MLLAAGDVPGKLMIAGEYAVLRPDGVALAVAVGRLAHWQVLADGLGQLRLHAFGALHTTELDHASAPATGLLAFAQRAVAVARSLWAHELNHSIEISVFGDVGGKKLGLGTSAAVTVAVLRAFAPALTSAHQIAQLARQVHAAAQAGQGSGYDVTTIAFGGVVAFWPRQGQVQALGWPVDLAAAAFYTGEPAPTAPALGRCAAMAPQLPAIRRAASAVLDQWPQSGSSLLSAVQACDDALYQAHSVRDAIFSPAVQQTRQFLLDNQLVPRLSGAGGGDCILGFGSATAVAGACAAWRAHGRVVAAELPADLAVDSESIHAAI
ncbi:MAG: hypothetical protein EXR77_11855 [Myxococcales bacterium]|nr:hypothetical protein [Myxococcales bacterium]